MTPRDRRPRKQNHGRERCQAGNCSHPAIVCLVILNEVKSSPQGWFDIQLDNIEDRNELSLDSSLRSA
jgi:hypothetical protein